MSSKIAQRLQRLTTEAEIARRKRQEEATKAVAALKEISMEDVERFSGIVPNLRYVVTYTEQDLMQNAHGEIAMVNEVKKRLREYLEERLKFYEDQL